VPSAPRSREPFRFCADLGAVNPEGTAGPGRAGRPFGVFAFVREHYQDESRGRDRTYQSGDRSGRRRRLSCPDFATARYLSVFARAGVTQVAVPYDITKISRLADDLESAWQRTLLLADHAAEGCASSFRARVRSAALKEVKREIEGAGAGTAVPAFNQNTKQRAPRI